MRYHKPIMKLASFLLLLTAVTALAATEEQVKTNFNVAPGGRLAVEVDSGAIEVASNATSQVTVDVWRKITRRNKSDEEQFLRDHPVSFVQDGNTVTVRCRDRETQRRWFNWGFRNNRNEAKYTIRVPAEFDTELKTSGGPIAARDLTGKAQARTSGGGLRFTRLHGPLDGHTSGGGIRMTDCEGPIKIDTSGGGIDVTGGGGSLDGHTSGGGVTVKDFAGPITVNTSGGGITVENIGGEVKGSTSGGRVSAVLPAPVPGNVSLSTSGGGVTVKVTPSAAFLLDAKTSGGGVSCDLPITIEGKMKHDQLKGTVNGGGPDILLRSSGGSIHVKKL